MPLNYEIRLNTLNSSSETEHFMVGEGWGERQIIISNKLRTCLWRI